MLLTGSMTIYRIFVILSNNQLVEELTEGGINASRMLIYGKEKVFEDVELNLYLIKMGESSGQRWMILET